MAADANKDISAIRYNHLNLPVSIFFEQNGTIDYLYNALGQKVQKRVETVPVSGPAEVAVTEYLGGFQYVDGVLQFFPTAEGYVRNVSNRYFYVYNYTDHLGNIRLSYGQDPDDHIVKVLEENHYYPFGLKHENYNVSLYDYEKYGLGEQEVALAGVSALQYKYKYNGKEYQDELGLNFYDYGARNYDPAIGRWMNIDPLVEKSRRWSPYSYCYNDPMRFVDPDGMQAADVIITAKDGTKLFTLDDGKKEVTTMTAQQAYKKGIQWFEPQADNYMPLKELSKKGAESGKMKEISSKDLKEFANKDRNMISYRQGGSGDWKASEDGGNGFLLVTMDGMPYWGDAVGQIPFSTDKVTDEVEAGATETEAIKETLKTGQENGDGKIIGGRSDFSNSYDNYMILRGAMYGTSGRPITKPVTAEEAKKYGLKK